MVIQLKKTFQEKLLFRNKLEKINLSKELFYSLSPLLYYGRFFGLSPLAYKKNDQYYSLKWSFAVGAYSYGFIITVALLFLYGLYLEFQVEVVYSVRFGDLTATVVSLTEYSLLFTTNLICVFIVPFKISDYLNYYKTLDEIDKLIPLKKTKRTRFTLTVILVVASLISWTTFLSDVMTWNIVTTKYQTLLSIVINFFPVYIMYFYFVIFELVYYALVHFIQIRVEMFNETLKSLEINSEDSQIEEIVLLKQFKFANRMDVSHGDFSVNRMQSIKNNSQANIKSCVKKLITAHLRICEAVSYVNSCYGVTILIVLGGLLIHLVITPFTLYLQLNNTQNMTFVLTQTCWMVGHILRVLLIVEPCEKCETGMKYSNFLVRKYLSCDYSDDVKAKLEILSIQLTCCPVEFSAAGLTSINRSLLTAISGAVTTYLVILFQFKN